MEQLTLPKLQLFNCIVNCHICDKSLGDDHVKDYCHITDKFRGAVHKKCIIYNFT